MTIVSEAIDPLWQHEKFLTIEILSKGSCHRNELKKQIREVQEKATFPPHSERAYAYWFRDLKERRIVTEKGKILSLTNLGRWVALGSMGTLLVRDEFVYHLVCNKCSDDIRIVLRIPLIDRLKPNSFIDIRCRVCDSLSKQHNLGSMGSQWGIADFYNEALADLKKFVPGVVGKSI
jgi:hypothetical protein